MVFEKKSIKKPKIKKKKNKKKSKLNKKKGGAEKKSVIKNRAFPFKNTRGKIGKKLGTTLVSPTTSESPTTSVSPTYVIKKITGENEKNFENIIYECDWVILNSEKDGLWYFPDYNDKLFFKEVENYINKNKDLEFDKFYNFTSGEKQILYSKSAYETVHYNDYWIKKNNDYQKIKHIGQPEIYSNLSEIKNIKVTNSILNQEEGNNQDYKMISVPYESCYFVAGPSGEGWCFANELEIKLYKEAEEQNIEGNCLKFSFEQYKQHENHKEIIVDQSDKKNKKYFIVNSQDDYQTKYEIKELNVNDNDKLLKSSEEQNLISETIFI